MNVSPTVSMPRALPPEHCEQLMRLAGEVSIPPGTRLFQEGARADRFWIIRTGTIALDMHVPGRQPAVIESLGHNELVGWSWLFAPYTWHLGAEAASPLRAYEFDATTVRTICQEDPAFGRTVARWVGDIVAHRLRAARTRLLDLYGPYGSGGMR